MAGSGVVALQRPSKRVQDGLEPNNRGFYRRVVGLPLGENPGHEKRGRSKKRPR